MKVVLAAPERRAAGEVENLDQRDTATDDARGVGAWIERECGIEGIQGRSGS